MEPSSQHTKRNKRFNFRTVKKVAKVGSLVIVFSVVASVVISIYTNNILGTIIQELIKLRTDGTYNIEYEELDYSFTENILKIKNLELSVDTTSENFIGIIHTGGEIAFSARAPYMYLDISDIWAIYFDRELKINGVRFDDPILNIQNYREDVGIVWQQDAGSLYDIIAGHLEVFKINQMEVKNGKFYFEKRNGLRRKYSIENVSFSIRNFLLDSASKQNKDKFFYTDDIDLEMRNQRIYLKDSIHTLFFKKLVLSTTKSEVSVDSLVVSENRRSAAARTHQDFYSIYVPSINIKDVDFKSAYNEEVLDIGKLNIHLPKIQISDFPVEYSRRDSTKSSLASLVLDYFSNIQIDSFSLKKATLGYQFKTSTKTQGFTLDSLNVELTHFQLDSSNLNSQRPLFYENLEFSVKDYQFNLPDSIHIFSFSNLVGSTIESHLTFENMRIRPRGDADLKKLLSKNKKNKTIDIFFPKAVFHSVGGQDFFNTDTLRIEKVEAEHPVVELIEYPSFSSRNDYSDSLIFNFFPILKTFAKALYIEKGSFTDGNFSWFLKEEKLVPKYLVHGFDLKFNQVKVDSSSVDSKKLFSAENFEIFSEKTILESPDDNFVFYGNNLFYSGESRILNAENVELTLLKKDQQAAPDKVNIRRLLCRGIDLNGIFINGDNDISYLKIVDPDIRIHRMGNPSRPRPHETSMLPLFEGLNVRQFSMENGNFDISMGDSRHFEAKGVFFDFDKFKSNREAQKKFVLQNYELKLRDLVYRDSAKNVLSINNLMYNPDDSTTVLNDLRFVSSRSSESRNFQHLIVPEAVISNWRPLNLYFHNEISPAKILLKDPDFTLTEGEKGGRRSGKRIGELIDKVEAERLIIENGKINYRKKRQDDSLFYKTDHIDLTLHHFKIDSTSTDEIFSLENVETLLQNNLLTFHNSRDTIFIKSIQKKETGNSFELDDLIYSHYDAKTNKKLLKSFVRKLEIREFDFGKLNEKSIEIKALHLVEPDVYYNDRLSSKSSSIKELVFLSPLNLKGSGFNRIKINSVRLDSGKVDLLLKEKLYSKPMRFENVGLEILEFDTDRKDKIFNAEDVKVSFEGIVYDLPDSLNYIKTGRITLSLSDSSLIVDDFSWMPKVGREEYAAIMGTQTDWLKIKAGKLRLSHMDYEKFLTKEGVIAQKFEIDSLDIYAFRDKRIPIKKDVYKPLPQELLKQLNLLVNIDTTVLRKGRIRYEEFAVDANKPGIVEFTEVHATAINVCNDSVVLQKRPKSFVDAEAKMMGEGKLTATFRFDMTSPENYFNIDATLEAMDLHHFNRILEPIAFVTIKKGKNNKLHMSTLANEDVAVGSMYFEYEDLKISLINKNTYDTKGMGPVIGSFFANTFIINRNNPRLILMKDGEIYFERDKNKSIFNYWAKIFFSGVVSSIGAKSNKKEIRNYEKMDDNQIKEKN